jgi:KDO2-lipid IV(A) lauroyltransferase
MNETRLPSAKEEVARDEDARDPEAGGRRPRGDALVRGLRLILLYVILRPIVLLPFRFQLAVGRALGRLGGRMAGKLRRTVRCNLRACFPELAPEQIGELERRHFESLGMSGVEMCFAWWASEKRVRERVDIVGIEHYHAVRAAGGKVLFLTAHFTTMELCAIALSLSESGLYGVYRAYDRNPLAEAVTREGRTRAAGLVERNDVKGMLRVLRSGSALWIASDQLVRPDKRSAIVRFFGLPCIVHGGVLDLARMSGARILPLLSLRLPDGRYRLTIEPPFEDMPGRDRAGDLQRIMRRIEAHVRLDPAQYMWVWRRFGRLPPEYPDIYAGC